LAAHFEHTSVFAPATIPLLYSAAMAMNGLTAFLFGRLFHKHGIVVLSVGISFSVLALPLGFFGGAAGGVLGVLCWASGLGVRGASLRAGIAPGGSITTRGAPSGT